MLLVWEILNREIPFQQFHTELQLVFISQSPTVYKSSPQCFQLQNFSDYLS